MEKRGQITIFIIVGIILLVGAALYIFVRDQTQYFKPEQVLSPEVQPVDLYVKECLRSTAENAILLISYQGGYLDFPDYIENDNRSYVAAGPDGVVKIPYWYYERYDYSPRLDDMEDEIAVYVNENIETCLDGLRPFQDQFNVRLEGDRWTTAQITEGRVELTYHFPIALENKQGLRVTDMTDFSASIDTHLKDMYDLAQAVMAEENANTWWEDWTMDLVALDSSIPDTGMDISCARKTWRLDQVKSRLDYLLGSNVHYVKMVGTDYAPFLSVIGGLETAYMQHHYYWNFTTLDHPGLHVNFDYAGPLELYARPSSGNIMSSAPISGAQFLSFLCLQNWHFTYDIRYPVVVKVTDERGLDNAPLTLTFAFPVMIDHNMPARVGLPTAASRQLREEVTSEEFCRDATVPYFVFVMDNVTMQDVSGAKVDMVCGPYRCELGETEIGLDGFPVISKVLPYCPWARFEVEAEGYLEGVHFDAVEQPASSAFVYLQPVHDLSNLVVKTHNLDTTVAGYTTTPAHDLEADESAMISISNPYYGFDSFAFIENSTQVTNLTIMGKRDSWYELSVYVFKDGDMRYAYIDRNWTLPWNEVAQAQTITIHTLGIFDYRDDDAMGAFLAGLEGYVAMLPAPELG